MYINYIKRDITIIKDKVLGIVLSINPKNTINYWVKILEKLNIFYKFIRKGVVIVVVTVAIIIDLAVIISLLPIISIDISI